MTLGAADPSCGVAASEAGSSQPVAGEGEQGQESPGADLDLRSVQQSPVVALVIVAPALCEITNKLLLCNPGII